MEPKKISHNHAGSDQFGLGKLMAVGYVRVGSQGNKTCRIQRGMEIKTEDGKPAGKVAALVLDSTTQEPVHILLGRLPLLPEYRLIPLDKIAGINQDVVHLHLRHQDLNDLAVWHSG